jgi:acetyltransferase-like isoleucine patch superfamily enzyme
MLDSILNKIKSRIKGVRDKVKIKLEGKENKVSLHNPVLKNISIFCVGNNNNIDIHQSILTNNIILINGNNNTIRINKNVNIAGSTIRISGNHHTLEIGSGSRLKETSFWFEDYENTITIGNGTTCEGAHIAATETQGKIEIGYDCMLSFGIDIRNGDSHTILDSETGKRINPAGDVKIGNHVWIGAHVQIVKNTIIEDGSVIGIRSLVSKNIPQNCIAAGNPAKIIKEKIKWDRDRSAWQKPTK